MGNGVDTHRLWEALYSGSIPITKRHPTYEATKDLPVLFVNTYEEINLELLRDFMDNLEIEKINLNKLSKEYWGEVICNNRENANYEKFKENKYETYYFLIKRKLKNKFYSYKKKIKTFKNRVEGKLS